MGRPCMATKLPSAHRSAVCTAENHCAMHLWCIILNIGPSGSLCYLMGWEDNATLLLAEPIGDHWQIAILSDQFIDYVLCLILDQQDICHGISS